MILPWDNASSEEILEDLRNYKKQQYDLWGKEIVDMTPIRCFRVKNLEIYTEDWAGIRELVATCPDEGKRDWLLSNLVAYHQRNYYDWDAPDSVIN